MNRLLLANLAAATAALSAGASVVATRVVVGEIDPVAVAFYRYVIAGGCLAPVLFALWPRDGLGAREMAKIAVLGALFFGFFPWAFSAALQYTTAARGAIGLATIPIQTLIIAALFGRELLTRGKIASVALAFAGIAVVFGPAAQAGGGGADYLIGDGLMLLGALSAAVYSVFGRTVLGRHGPLFATALGMVFGMLALLPLAAADGALTWPAFSAEGWIAMLFLGTFGGAIQFSLFTWALRWLPPTRTVIYLTLNPISAMLLAVLMLGESVTAALLTGLALVITGILVANLPRGAERTPGTAAPPLQVPGRSTSVR